MELGENAIKVDDNPAVPRNMSRGSAPVEKPPFMASRLSSNQINGYAGRSRMSGEFAANQMRNIYGEADFRKPSSLNQRKSFDQPPQFTGFVTNTSNTSQFISPSGGNLPNYNSNE